MPTDPAIQSLLVMLDGAFHGRGWQGTTLLGSLRGVTPMIALFRPARGRRCIWEHTIHAAYWKYAVRRIVSPRADGAFPRSPSNWPRVLDAPDEAAWRRDVALLKQCHARLREAVATMDPDLLFKIAGNRKFRFVDYIVGAAAHDAYHTGQIQLIKRLARA